MLLNVLLPVVSSKQKAAEKYAFLRWKRIILCDQKFNLFGTFVYKGNEIEIIFSLKNCQFLNGHLQKNIFL